MFDSKESDIVTRLLTLSEKREKTHKINVIGINDWNYLLCNEEFLVKFCHYQKLNTSLPFVHTARRSYRLNEKMKV